MKFIKYSITYVAKFFKRLGRKQAVSTADRTILDKIISEDKELLEKLAR